MYPNKMLRKLIQIFMTEVFLKGHSNLRLVPTVEGGRNVTDENEVEEWCVSLVKGTSQGGP